MKTLKASLKSFLSIMLLAFALFTFPGCSNTGKGMQEDYNENKEEVEDAAEETGEDIEDAADEAGDEIEDATDDND